MSELEKTEFALELIKSHLQNFDGDVTAIENYLVQYLLVCYYSEMETSVKRVIKNRLHFNGDERLENFVTKTNDSMIKRVKTSDIRDVLRLFGNECNTTFSNTVSDRDIQHYSNIINNRHLTSHGPGAMVSLLELEEGIKSGRKILAQLEVSIA